MQPSSLGVIGNFSPQNSVIRFWQIIKDVGVIWQCHESLICIYTREDYHGTWEWNPGKGETSSKPSFPGSMLNFRDVSSTPEFLYLHPKKLHSSPSVANTKSPWHHTSHGGRANNTNTTLGRFLSKPITNSTELNICAFLQVGSLDTLDWFFRCRCQWYK